MSRQGDTLGYARVSTVDQDLASQEDRLEKAGAIAHFERQLIAERTRDGIAAARQRGKIPGRPRLAEETVSAVRNLTDAGMTPGQAAKQLGTGRSTAYRSARDLSAI